MYGDSGSDLRRQAPADADCCSPEGRQTDGARRNYLTDCAGVDEGCKAIAIDRGYQNLVLLGRPGSWFGQVKVEKTLAAMTMMQGSDAKMVSGRWQCNKPTHAFAAKIGLTARSYHQGEIGSPIAGTHADPRAMMRGLLQISQRPHATKHPARIHGPTGLGALPLVDFCGAFFLSSLKVCFAKPASFT